MRGGKTKWKAKGQAQARKRSPGGKPSRRTRTSPARGRAFNVAADMRRDPSLSFTQAARKRKIDPRSVIKQIASDFYKDTSGRVRVRPTDRFRQTLHIPSNKPDVRVPFPREIPARGNWLAAGWMPLMLPGGVTFRN